MITKPIKYHVLRVSGGSSFQNSTFFMFAVIIKINHQSHNVQSFILSFTYPRCSLRILNAISTILSSSSLGMRKGKSYICSTAFGWRSSSSSSAATFWAHILLASK